MDCKHARLPCLPVSLRVCLNSCPLSWWCYLIISSSAAPFSFHLDSFPPSGSFPVSCPFCTKWPMYWKFSFSISPFNEYSGLISFRIDWFDLPAVQGTLESLLQHHNKKKTVFQCSAFFMVQVSFLYMTTGKIKLWLYGLLTGKWCLCFLIHHLVLS